MNRSFHFPLSFNGFIFCLPQVTYLKIRQTYLLATRLTYTVCTPRMLFTYLIQSSNKCLFRQETKLSRASAWGREGQETIFQITMQITPEGSCDKYP